MSLDSAIEDIVKGRRMSESIERPPSRSRGAKSYAKPVSGALPAQIQENAMAKVLSNPLETAPSRKTGEAIPAMKPTEGTPRRSSTRLKAASVGGQNANSSHGDAALDAQNPDDGHSGLETQRRNAVVGGENQGQTLSENPQQPAPVLSINPSKNPIIESILYNWRLRQRWHRAEKSLTLQAKALLRSLSGGDKDKANTLFDTAYKPFEKARAAERKAANVRAKANDAPPPSDPKPAVYEAVGLDIGTALMPFLVGIASIEADRLAIEKKLATHAKELPIWQWVDGIHGFGLNTLASIVGEAGDIGCYKSVSAVWKRMGLAVISGGRQRKVADAEAALEHGYSPSRRAVAYLLGQWLIMAGEKNPYRAVYHARKVYELERTAAIAADPELIKRYSRSGKYAPQAHANNRAARYMVKRVLRELYAAWRAIERGEAASPPGHHAVENHEQNAGAALLQAAE